MLLGENNLKLKLALLSRARIFSVIISACLVTSLHCPAQNMKLSSNASLAEKVYLQLDSKLYWVDQIIWFKAIVVTAGDHLPTELSGVLHVELIAADEKIVDSKLVKLVHGIGEGFFQLDQNYAEGLYLVRAYTEWDKNFGTDFFFNQYIHVFSAVTTAKGPPVSSTLIPIKGQKKEPGLIVSPDTSVYQDLQFFPESGRLVQGLPGLLGFKYLDSNGKGRVVSGDIVNREGKVITSFKSNRLGMGSVLLDRVDSSERYSARITAGDNLQNTYPLPLVAPVGNTLSVKQAGDKISLEVRSNYLVNDSVFIRVSCRGNDYYDIRGRLRNGRLSFSLGAAALPEGIIDFTLADASGRPVAERLYFNERTGSRIAITMTTDKASYTQREQTRVMIETKDSAGSPLPASVSLLVINKSGQEEPGEWRQNILSCFLLDSDLKGEIEDPGFYFDKGVNRSHDLDALLLTQGWRKYKYSGGPVELPVQPEINLTVSGRVKGSLFSGKGKKGVGLTMMTFGAHPTVQQAIADSLGRFSFAVDDYGQEMNILIQSENKTGTKKNYQIELDKRKPPPISFNQVRPTKKPDSLAQAFVKTNLERKKAESEFKAATEGITLGEVVLKSYFMTPERKAVADKYGKPQDIIGGDAIREKEARWSFGLYSVIMFNFPEKIKVTRLANGMLYASLYNSEPTLVVIDGIAVSAVNYDLIPAIPPSEVKSVELIPYAKNFNTLYCEVVPGNCANAPVWGNVIAIYTRGGKGLFGANAAVGIVKASIPVFAAPREFYAAKYEQLKPDDWLKPDLRTLIHWEADVKMDSLGKGTVIFYNGDNTGTTHVIAEAISAEGQIGYQELFYDVRKRN